MTEDVVEDEEEHHESFFAFTAEVMDHVSVIPGIPEVYLASAQTSAGHMVLDTACQKLCAGKTWCSSHEELLNQHSLCSSREPTSKRFRFGAGPVQQATERVLLPCVLQGKPLVLRTCELQAEVPLLGSLTLLTTLGATIDLLQRKVYFQKLRVAVPLVRLANRHIAVNILQMETLDGTFPAKFHLWSPTTDELALPPEDAARQKGATQHYRLDDEEERGSTTRFPLKRNMSSGRSLSALAVATAVTFYPTSAMLLSTSERLQAWRNLVLRTVMLGTEMLHSATVALRMKIPEAAIVLPYMALRAQGEIRHGAHPQEVPFLYPPEHMCRHQNVSRSGTGTEVTQRA